MNAVGVDLNTASVPLLARVSGVTESLAESIVAHREKVGAFRSRKGLLEVPGWAPRPLSNAPDSCVFAEVTTRWMRPECTPSRIRWCAKFWTARA